MSAYIILVSTVVSWWKLTLVLDEGDRSLYTRAVKLIHHCKLDELQARWSCLEHGLLSGLQGWKCGSCSIKFPLSSEDMAVKCSSHCMFPVQAKWCCSMFKVWPAGLDIWQWDEQQQYQFQWFFKPSKLLLPLLFLWAVLQAGLGAQSHIIWVLEIW